MKKIMILAPAKINLFLDITGKKADGYHEILSVMQSVDLYDKVFLSLNDSGVINVDCTEADIPNGEGNIAYKAAKLFFSLLGDPSQGCDILIQKNIPHAAGLAGGSTDAAAVLIGLNSLFDNRFTQSFLAENSVTIGADVPFCIIKGTQMASGIGEILSPLSSMPECYIIIAKSGEGVSTKEAYAAIDQSPCEKHDISPLIDGLGSGDLVKICKNTFNAFENIILPRHEGARRIKSTLEKHGALTSLMSGSGPSVFGIFNDRQKALDAADELNNMNIHANICKPI